MDESDTGITEDSEADFKRSLPQSKRFLKSPLFRDDLLKLTCERIQGGNATGVIRDISLLIVPSAEILAAYGATNLQVLLCHKTGESQA
jgi:hypothetical protein